MYVFIQILYYKTRSKLQLFSGKSLVNGNQHPHDLFLLLDEVPCNSNSGRFSSFYGRPSGDWSGLNPCGVHLMMALKPFGDRTNGFFTYLADLILSSNQSLKLCFPEDNGQLRLARIYRCTQNISKFYELVVKNSGNTFTNYDVFNINASSQSYNSGHEIHGEPPEILFLHQCNCFGFCQKPLDHIFVENKSKILSLFKRLQGKVTNLNKASRGVG